MSNLSDFVFIPLILTLLINVILICLAIRAKVKFGKSSLNILISLLIQIAGTLYTIVNLNDDNSFFIYAATTALSFGMMIAYFTYSVPAEETPKKEEIIEEPEEEEQVQIATIVEEKDKSLLDVTLDFLVNAAGTYTGENGLNHLLEYVNNRLIKETNATGGAILLIDDFEDVISVKAFAGEFPPPYELPKDLPHKVIRVETSFRFAQFPLHDNIFGEIARTGHAENITDSKNDTRLFQNEPEEFLKLGSYMIVPMKVGDTVIGITALARTADKQPFGDAEFNVAQVLTDFASTIVKNVYSFQEVIEHSDLTRDADIASSVLSKILPKKLPAIPTISLGNYTKAAEGVCADYYDVLPSRKDRISFVMADVAGKGMNSLIVMIMIRSILRLVVNTKQSAATILNWANRGICADNSLDHFATLALLNYDSTTKKIQYSNAGSMPIMLFEAASQTVKNIACTSEPIGVEKTTEYKDV